MGKNYSAEFKWRFADGYNDSATITMMQYEFGLTKSTVTLWRERIDQGGVGTMTGRGRTTATPGAQASRRRSLSSWRAQQCADTRLGEALPRERRALPPTGRQPSGRSWWRHARSLSSDMDIDAPPPCCAKRWAFVSPIKRDLEKDIDWYSNVRIKKRLDGGSPVEYRLGRAA